MSEVFLRLASCEGDGQGCCCLAIPVVAFGFVSLSTGTAWSGISRLQCKVSWEAIGKTTHVSKH